MTAARLFNCVILATIRASFPLSIPEIVPWVSFFCRDTPIIVYDGCAGIVLH
jgi:hypothetical protein